jgi:hypothetical protein
LPAGYPSRHLFNPQPSTPKCSYPEASVKYFLEPFRIASAAYINLLSGLIALGPVADPLIDHLTSPGVEPKLVALLDSAAPPALAALPPAAAGGGEDKEKGDKEAEEGKKEGGEEAGGEKKEEPGGDAAASMDVDDGGDKPAADVGKDAPPGAAKPGASPLLTGAAAAGAREAAAGFHAVQLVAGLARARPEWLAGRPALFEALRKRWDVPARRARLAQVRRAALLQTGLRAPLKPSSATRALHGPLTACAPPATPPPAYPRPPAPSPAPPSPRTPTCRLSSSWRPAGSPRACSSSSTPTAARRARCWRSLTSSRCAEAARPAARPPLPGRARGGPAGPRRGSRPAARSC